MMLLVDLVTARCGSSDSPAASVAISLPMKEKTTSRTPVRIAPGPLGRKPPWAVRLLEAGLVAVDAGQHTEDRERRRRR